MAAEFVCVLRESFHGILTHHKLKPSKMLALQTQNPYTLKPQNAFRKNYDIFTNEITQILSPPSCTACIFSFRRASNAGAAPGGRTKKPGKTGHVSK